MYINLQVEYRDATYRLDLLIGSHNCFVLIGTNN
jgi:hypothetical protein